MDFQKNKRENNQCVNAKEEEKVIRKEVGDIRVLI